MLEAYEAYGDYESMMELVQGMVCHVAQKVLGTLSVKRSRQTNIRNIVDELVRQFDGLFKEAIATSDEHSTRKMIADELRDSLSPLISRLSELRLKIDEASVDEAGLEIRQLITKAEIEVTAMITIAKPVALPLAGDEEAIRNFSAAWKQSHIDVRANLNSGLQRLNVELENPTIELGQWKRAKYKDLVREKAGADWFEISPAERRQRAHDLGAEIGKEYEDFEVTGAVFEKLIEPTLIQPTFVTHLPKELVPLAKLSPDDPTTVEVFECCINGQEIAPAYTEQNDPIAQRERLEHQAGGEQQKLDEDFLVALEHGMPPAGGMGMGIDRLCMMLLGQESIRDVILFPQLKPK
jgi:lysyl-tRNA synthetase class 2